MRPIRKAAIVLLLYIGALLVACAVSYAYDVALQGQPGRDGGMAAFGDMLLFLGVLAVASLPATGTALCFLRPVKAFWVGAACVAALSALTCVLALIDYLAMRGAPPAGPVAAWSALASVRLILSPLFVLPLALAGLFAPTRGARTVLLASAGVDAAAFGYVVGWLVLSNLR